MANECIQGCLPALCDSDAQPRAWASQVQTKGNEGFPPHVHSSEQ